MEYISSVMYMSGQSSFLWKLIIAFGQPAGIWWARTLRCIATSQQHEMRKTTQRNIPCVLDFQLLEVCHLFHP